MARSSSQIKVVELADHVKQFGSSGYLTCPLCGGHLKQTINSRIAFVGEGDDRIAIVRRRRTCRSCGERSTTLEMTENGLLQTQKALLQAKLAKILSDALKAI